ncbi:MAG: PF20097 family protein [Anaerolineales bacterium]|nr:PF20097 family protein [Anaerolineales bacterium]
MAEAKVCPKCKGSMKQGRIMKFNEYTLKSKYVYVFAPDEESAPDISKAFSGKPLSKERKPLAAYCCDECGFVEFYGLPA